MQKETNKKYIFKAYDLIFQNGFQSTFKIFQNVSKYLLSGASVSERSSYVSTQSFLCDSTPHKLLNRQPWNSTQRQIPLLTMSPWNKILEKSSGSGSGDKNVLFTFLLETILLINGSFWNFAHEDIIDHHIISNGKKTHICWRKTFFRAKYPIRREKLLFWCARLNYVARSVLWIFKKVKAK